MLAPAQRTGYDFAGWFDGAEGGKASGTELNVWDLWLNKSETVTLYVKWTPIRYRIAYYFKGSYIGDDYYTIEDSFALPDDNITGHYVEDWYYDSALTQPTGGTLPVGRTGDIYTPTKAYWDIAEDVTLTAHWYVASIKIVVPEAGDTSNRRQTGRAAP